MGSEATLEAGDGACALVAGGNEAAGFAAGAGAGLLMALGTDAVSTGAAALLGS